MPHRRRFFYALVPPPLAEGCRRSRLGVVKRTARIMPTAISQHPRYDEYGLIVHRVKVKRGGTKKGPDMTIDVYGATWCGDCRQAKNTLDKLGAAYTWHNIEEEEGAADRAVAISGQMHIPVVRYDDGSFQVEPSAVDIRNKLQELGLLAD